MNNQDRLDQVLSENRKALSSLDDIAIEQLINAITRSKRIYIIGAGRTKCVTAMFAMRLAQAGFTVYMVGEVTTPAASKGDLLIAASGSGETETVLTLASKAIKSGASIFSLTSSTESRLAKLSDMILPLPAKPAGSTQLLGNFHETCLLLILDLVIDNLIIHSNKTDKDLSNNHANIE